MALTHDPLVKDYAECTGALLEFTSLISSDVPVQFNAFLTEFDQSFSSQWNTEEVFGRMDPIASFKNTKRTISLGWTIPASIAAEAKNNLTKVSKLTKMLYPAYSAEGVAKEETDDTKSGKDKATKKATKQQITLKTAAHTQTLSKPPLIKIKYANLLNGLNGNGQLGWIESLSVRPVLDMGFFTENKNMYPKVIQISCSFTVLHQQNLGHTQSGQWMGIDNFPFYKNQ